MTPEQKAELKDWYNQTSHDTGEEDFDWLVEENLDWLVRIIDSWNTRTVQEPTARMIDSAECILLEMGIEMTSREIASIYKAMQEASEPQEGE